MSKYTKVIAALGVAAGLGVASLPLGAFADTTVHTGAVNVEATVPETLVVKIDNNEIAKDNATAVLGNAVIFDDGTVTGSDPKVVNAGGHAVAEDATTLTISTNQPNGFKLNIQNTSKKANGTDISTDGALLRDGGDDGKDADKIKPFTTETKAEDGEDEGWGFYIAKEVKDMTVASPSFTATPISNTTYITTEATPADHGYFGVPVASTVLDDVYESTGMTEAEYQYKVSYGINIAKGKAAGTYKGQVTYVVTANPARS